MTYYYCEYCEEIFADEDAKERWDGDEYGQRLIHACPNCGSTDLTEADYCRICGKPVEPGSVEVCDECAETLHKSWVGFVETVMDLRMKAGENLSADFLDCEQAALDYLSEVGII